MLRARALAVPLAVALAGCQAVELPPVQAQGAIITYHGDASLCPGALAEIETWLVAVAARVGVDEGELAPIDYYVLDAEAAKRKCKGAAACAEFKAGVPSVYTPSVFDRHELIHAIHLAGWGKRPPILEEGLAMLFDDTSPQSFEVEAFADELDGHIEATKPDGVYFAGLMLSYWVYLRHGPEALTELLARSSRGMSAQAFRDLFEDVTGESLEALAAAVGDQPACQLSTCYGEVTPWDGVVWQMDAAAGECGGDIGWTEDSLLRHHELVEISEPGWYEFGSDAADVFLSACGDCAPLVSGVFAASSAPVGRTEEVWLEPGVYKVEAHSLRDGPVGAEVWLVSAP